MGANYDAKSGQHGRRRGQLGGKTVGKSGEIDRKWVQKRGQKGANEVENR